MPCKSFRVLIVDDEHSLADTLALILNRSGHNALAVYDGLEAVDTARRFNPHVLLSDVRMPGLDGFELAQYFAVHYPDCRVLLMSGHASAVESAGIFVESGAFVNVLTKPIFPETILDFISSCGENLVSV